jgi:hypothetical protein
LKSHFATIALAFQLGVAAASASESGWFDFSPATDGFGSPIDLRVLNEKFAGEHGAIGVKGSDFIHAGNSQPIRFWGVNGPPQDLKGDELKRACRVLAKYGVNLARIHAGYFDENGEADPAKVRHAHEIVAALKEQGIYSYFSIYFPLWFSPRSGNQYLAGYNGKQHPFAALFFNKEFQAQYRNWWKALLTTPDPTTGKKLVDELAIAGLEIQNEDSLFFWTFAEKNLPREQWQILEKMFGDWVKDKYGSIQKAYTAWNNLRLKEDNLEKGQLGFRPLWNIFNERSPRDQDTVQFLAELQKNFYDETYRFLRSLGFKGVITASNWTTASPRILGPIEKWTYSGTDFIDRHGYFSANLRGPNSEWSIRDGHLYMDRSALRFDAEIPGKPRQFVHPAMDPEYNGMPSMISETTWNRPNRYRTEAPLYFAAYGDLQGSDAIVHFAFDGAHWSVKPGYFMQPWTLMSPVMMGQFPAAALIYRKGLVREGKVLAQVTLGTNELMHLEGTTLPQDAALDELRLKDLNRKREVDLGQTISPLLHYAGKAEVHFTAGPSSTKVADLKPFIDTEKQKVTSTTGELNLDYGTGLLVINAEQAQGFCGNLKAGGKINTTNFEFESPLDLGAIVVVAMDGQSLAKSKKMLLQVMSEEKPTGFKTEQVSEQMQKIISIGKDPWMVRNLEGKIWCKRQDAKKLSVTPLQLDGTPLQRSGTAELIELRPDTIYYLIESSD